MKEFEDDDPMELQAISIPEGDPQVQATAFAEEFLSMGLPKENVLELFRNPFYTGTYRLWVKLGDEKICQIIGLYRSRFAGS